MYIYHTLIRLHFVSQYFRQTNLLKSRLLVSWKSQIRLNSLNKNICTPHWNTYRNKVGFFTQCYQCIVFYGPLGRLLWPEAEIKKIKKITMTQNFQNPMLKKKMNIANSLILCVLPLKNEKWKICLFYNYFSYVPNFNKSLICLHVSLSRIIVCLWFYLEMTNVISVVNLILYNPV